MTTITPTPDAGTKTPARRRWRMPWSTAGIATIALVGILTLLYPSTASWFGQYEQSQMIEGLDVVVERGPETLLLEKLEEAHAYNDALVGGALLAANTRVPIGQGTSSGRFDYYSMLSLHGMDTMGRLKIPAIHVDLPIYHGTSDATLAKGVGHLEGTSLPVGGVSQHSVLTAHRGLPEATLFNDLHKLKIGDRFVIEVMGEVLTYEVFDTQTVWPHETQSLVPRYGEDIVTLVTCAAGHQLPPLPRHRQRVTPTPLEDVAKAGQRPEIPGFPWWSVALAASLVAYVTIIVRGGMPPKPTQSVDESGSAQP